MFSSSINMTSGWGIHFIHPNLLTTRFNCVVTNTAVDIHIPHFIPTISSSLCTSKSQAVKSMMSHFIVTGTIILADICFIVKRLHIAHKIGDRFEKWMMRTFFCGKKLPCIIVHYYCHMCVLTFQVFGGCLFMGSMKNTIVIHFFLFEMPRCIHNTAATLFVMCQRGLEKVHHGHYITFKGTT